MKKREDFAVSLRKKKTQDLIVAKRRKLMENSSSIGATINADGTSVARTEEEAKESKSNQLYRGYLMFEKDNESFEKMLSELCPVAA